MEHSSVKKKEERSNEFSHSAVHTTHLLDDLGRKGFVSSSSSEAKKAVQT